MEQQPLKVDFAEQFKNAMRESKVGQAALARALADTIDPGVYTIDAWEQGVVTPPEQNWPIIFQAIRSLSRE